MHVRYVARSDVGLGRDGNEDAALAGPAVLAVADGMGGHAAGEIASSAAIHEFSRAGLRDEPDPQAALARFFAAANARISQLAAELPEREGMGTTATVVLFGHPEPGTMALGHIGDSRAYLLRENALRQLTKDHTFVQTLVDDEQITPSEARNHPARSVVIKVLQGQDVIEPDISLVDIRPGDRILMCTDGLTDVMTDEDIEDTLISLADLDAAADELIRLSVARGGPDNITVVLADVLDLRRTTDAEPPSPTYIVGAANEA